MSSTKQFGVIPRKVPRERIIVLGGGCLFICLALVVLFIVSAGEPVDARNTTTGGRNITDDAFGNVKLVVPIAPVPKGTQLSQIEVRMRSWPRTEVPETAVRDLDVMRDLYAKVDTKNSGPIAELTPL